MSRRRRPERYGTESGDCRSRGELVSGLLAAAVALTIVVALLLASFWFEEGAEVPPKAAIVDHLSLTHPNPSFVQNAAVTLQEAGYEVDYYPGEVVTVNSYRHLPSRDYKLIILRVHSARLQDVWRSTFVDIVELFTSEPYSLTRYTEEQELGRLGRVAYFYEDREKYFGIAPRFITESMQGEFDDATVIMMGCNGLSTEATAEAFIQKGAKAVIGWDDLVSADHTDAATERLLEHLLIGGLSAEEAVAETMAEVGPDPAYDSVLLSYPPEG